MAPDCNKAAVEAKDAQTTRMAELDVAVGMTEEVGKVEIRDGTHVTDLHGHVYLLPRPSRSPDDPLNWSQLRKWTVLAIVCWFLALAASATQFLSFVLPQVQEDYPEESFSNINLLFTIATPLVAPGDIIWFFCAFKWANLLGAINPYIFDQLLAARILSGFGLAPTDALCFIMVQSFTFVHERGTYMAILASVGGAFNSLVCVATTWITIETSLRGIGSFVCLVGFWLLCPETNFCRDESDLAEPITKEEFREWRKDLGQGEYSGLLINPFTGNKNIPKHSFMDVAKWFWLALLNPAMWWLGVFQIVIFGGFSAVATYFAILLESPPWSWSPANVSFINFTVVPMAIIGVLIGMFSDWSIIKLAKRRGGIPKLEDRLFITPFPVVFGIAGLVGFGATAQSFHAGNAPHWFACVFNYFLMISAFCLSAQLSLNSESGLAMLTMVCALRDLGSFGLSYGIVGFVDKVGFLNSFGVYGALFGFFSLGAIPIYIYGERIRLYFNMV
ncbi:unnamed protein product [Clonostachys rosea]|uniref:Major facilitator superfamily (MFS) profile domain-containing protein n=1 Tax=Bionectria ochroleuca TaxID=29856 RepID=A0ABY6UDA1_BIOOC|nr:unnamed protein product [Clonostachys rosea]